MSKIYKSIKRQRVDQWLAMTEGGRTGAWLLKGKRYNRYNSTMISGGITQVLDFKLRHGNCKVPLKL